MKRNFKTLFISALLVTVPLFMFAQPPLPGQTPAKPGDGNQVGGTGGPTAPIGNGTFILITLAAAYGLRKVYELRDVKEEVTE